jgi:hypothetical protein
VDDDTSKLSYVCRCGIQTNLTVEKVTPRVTWGVGTQWLEVTKAHHGIAGRGKWMEIVVRGRYRWRAGRKVEGNAYQEISNIDIQRSVHCPRVRMAP